MQLSFEPAPYRGLLLLPHNIVATERQATMVPMQGYQLQFLGMIAYRHHDREAVSMTFPIAYDNHLMVVSYAPNFHDLSHALSHDCGKLENDLDLRTRPQNELQQHLNLLTFAEMVADYGLPDPVPSVLHPAIRSFHPHEKHPNAAYWYMEYAQELHHQDLYKPTILVAPPHP